MSVSKTDRRGSNPWGDATHWNYMYRVISKDEEQDFENLDLAMAHAKLLNVFVTIIGGKYDIVGKFGVDEIVDGKTPDGVEYGWVKRRYK